MYIYFNLSRLIWFIQHRQIPFLVVILPWKLHNESKENLTLQRRPWLCPRRWNIKDILLRHFINYIYKCTISWFCFIRNVIYKIFCNINDVLVESRACWLDDRCILSFNEWFFFNVDQWISYFFFISHIQFPKSYVLILVSGLSILG